MVRQRKMARRLLVQALYQWQMTGADLQQIESEFMADKDMQEADAAFFRELLHKLPQQLDRVDEVLAPLLDRAIDEVDCVERAVLRLGAYELLERLDVPYKVVLNESVELARRFGSQEGHRYVNGVLDRLASQVRATEIKGA